VISLVQPELRKLDVKVTTDLTENLRPVNGNEIELQQVALNLIMNGVQAMRSNEPDSRSLHIATANVSLANNEAGVEAAVRDSGGGFDPTKVNQLFEPFYTTKANGIGMGLAINRTIIQAHGGTIVGTPNVDRGATFRFRLPTIRAAARQSTLVEQATDE
ncbi:MAG: ATP-binding protein, partial [Planctomycetota bacterium]